MRRGSRVYLHKPCPPQASVAIRRPGKAVTTTGLIPEQAATYGGDAGIGVLLSFIRGVYADLLPQTSMAWLHAHRTVGGDRHHRHLDRPARACRAKGPRGGGTLAVQQQPEADDHGPP